MDYVMTFEPKYEGFDVQALVRSLSTEVSGYMKRLSIGYDPEKGENGQGEVAIRGLNPDRRESRSIADHVRGIVSGRTVWVTEDTWRETEKRSLD